MSQEGEDQRVMEELDSLKEATEGIRKRLMEVQREFAMMRSRTSPRCSPSPPQSPTSGDVGQQQQREHDARGSETSRDDGGGSWGSRSSSPCSIKEYEDENRDSAAAGQKDQVTEEFSVDPSGLDNPWFERASQVILKFLSDVLLSVRSFLRSLGRDLSWLFFGEF